MEKRGLVLITGGSRGIGASTVRKFCRENYNVVFVYRSNEEEAKALAEETGALALKADVSVLEEIEKAAKEGKTYFGRQSYDVVVANAGITRTSLFSTMDIEEINKVMSINFGGVVNTLKAVVDDMVREKKGSIVTVSSMWGVAGCAMESAYSASKHAVVGLTRSLAKELGPSSVRVNSVAPGVIMTDMSKGLDENIIEMLRDKTPLAKLGQPENIADAIYFLGSEASSFITGQVLSVDGGFLL